MQTKPDPKNHTHELQIILAVMIFLNLIVISKWITERPEWTRAGWWDEKIHNDSLRDQILAVKNDVYVLQNSFDAWMLVRDSNLVEKNVDLNNQIQLINTELYNHINDNNLHKKKRVK